MQITAALLLLLFLKPSPSVAVCACVDHILQLPESGHLRQAAYLHRTKAFVLALSRCILQGSLASPTSQHYEPSRVYKEVLYVQASFVPVQNENDEQAALAHLIGQYVLRVELAHGACSRQQSQALPQLAGASARRRSQRSSRSSGWLVVLAFKLPCLDEHALKVLGTRFQVQAPVRLRLDGVHGAGRRHPSQAGLHPLFGPACLVASNSRGKFCGKMVSKYTSPIYGKYIIYPISIVYHI